MLIPTKIQIDKKNFDFIKQVHKKLDYKSLSEYIREAVNVKVAKDRKRLRELERKAAFEMIGKAQYENVFESIEGEDWDENPFFVTLEPDSKNGLGKKSSVDCFQIRSISHNRFAKKNRKHLKRGNQSYKKVNFLNSLHRG